MESVTFERLINNIKIYNLDGIEMITQAYEYAKSLHEAKGQKRESGEPYISHPLAVAYILSEMHADTETIVAALLHDVIEDTEATKEDIAESFGEEVANLVDGVTKISKMNFSTKSDEIATNTRKIITGITTDVRIIIIKLADRLHNMRTLQYKSEYKQKENAVETLEIYVPLAYYIGAYRIKSELEDLSLQYLKPDVYCEYREILEQIQRDTKETLNEMFLTISNMLNDENIPYEIKIRTKNIYGVYKQLSQNQNTKIHDIHDLLALKVMVDNVNSCYQTLGLVHSKYPPINDKFKDYIAVPKTNMYRSLHTTVFGPDTKLVQTQIRTFEMDKIASFGLTAYWDMYNSREKMQRDLREKFQFYRSLDEINNMTSDNQVFLDQVKSEVFSSKVYVYTTKGDVIELPYGATPIDFAYRIHTDLGNTMISAVVNDRHVPVDYTLQNKDRVRIISDIYAYGPRLEWLDIVHTSYAKRRIKEFKTKKQIGEGE